jgi:hypothetical protein
VALTLLQTARNETARSQQLGYLSSDSEYKALDGEISSIESAIKSTDGTDSIFSHLGNRISFFIKEAEGT